MNKKTLVWGIGIVILLAGVFLWTQSENDKTNQSLPISHSVVLGETMFKVRVANTPETRTLGLSYFKELPSNEGMIFLFDQPGAYAFWMRDMNFPIDVVWLKMNRANTYQVIGFIENVAPETYPESFMSPGSIDAFLELPAGTIHRLPTEITNTEMVLLTNSI